MKGYWKRQHEALEQEFKDEFHAGIFALLESTLTLLMSFDADLYHKKYAKLFTCTLRTKNELTH